MRRTKSKRTKRREKEERRRVRREKRRWRAEKRRALLWFWLMHQGVEAICSEFGCSEAEARELIELTKADLRAEAETTSCPVVQAELRLLHDYVGGQPAEELLAS